MLRPIGAPLTHASRHAPGGADDIYVNGGWDDSAGRYSVLPKISNTGSVTMTTGLVNWTLFRAKKDYAFTKLFCHTRGTAGVGGTLARMGMFTVDGSGNLTLAARTAADATLFSGAFTGYERALDTAGGFPASYTLTRGLIYAFGAIWVGSGATPVGSGCPSSNGVSLLNTGYSWCRSRTGQADLSDATNAQATGTPGNALFAECAP